MSNQHTKRWKEEEIETKRIHTEYLTYSFKAHKKLIRDIDNLVREGKYISRSEFIRYAIRLLLKDSV